MLELHVPRAGDPPGVPFVRLAHVDEHGLAALKLRGRVLHADLDLGVLECTHAPRFANAPRRPPPTRGRTRDLGALKGYMRPQSRPSRVEERVVALAGRQEGVIGVRQLRESGADAAWVK